MEPARSDIHGSKRVAGQELAAREGCAQHVKKVSGRERGQSEGAEALKEAMGVDGCE